MVYSNIQNLSNFRRVADVLIDQGEDEEYSYNLLRNVAFSLYSKTLKLTNNQQVALFGKEKPHYVTKIDDTRHPKDDPIYNPHGIWSLRSEANK